MAKDVGRFDPARLAALRHESGGRIDTPDEVKRVVKAMKADGRIDAAEMELFATEVRRDVFPEGAPASGEFTPAQLAFNKASRRFASSEDVPLPGSSVRIGPHPIFDNPEALVNSIGQLDLTRATRADYVRCVAASSVADAILSGPEAVQGLIDRILADPNPAISAEIKEGLRGINLRGGGHLTARNLHYLMEGVYHQLHALNAEPGDGVSLSVIASVLAIRDGRNPDTTLRPSIPDLEVGDRAMVVIRPPGTPPPGFPALHMLLVGRDADGYFVYDPATTTSVSGEANAVTRYPSITALRLAVDPLDVLPTTGTS